MTQATFDTRFCSVCAQQAGLDPAGSAYSYQHFVAAELPLPWPVSMYSTPGKLPQELLDYRNLLIEAYQRGEPMNSGAYAIAPDKEYSVPGHRRVLSYRRPAGQFASFEAEEYLVPEKELGPLCWALLVETASLARFDEYRLPLGAQRDLLVCTHGTVDAACATFGFPAYRRLRRLAEQAPEQLRVWRVSHFGGHVYAPTLIEMPDFCYWGFVEAEEAPLLVRREGDVATLRACYRGWAGVEDSLLQVAERELFVRHGWAWRGFLKAGKLLSQDTSAPAEGHEAEPAWAEVQIDFTAPDTGEQGSYVARVERSGHITTAHSSGDPQTYAYPQYSVTSLERIA